MKPEVTCLCLERKNKDYLKAMMCPLSALYKKGVSSVIIDSKSPRSEILYIHFWPAAGTEVQI